VCLVGEGRLQFRVNSQGPQQGVRRSGKYCIFLGLRVCMQVQRVGSVDEP
jgi:hypothetical protein